MLLVQAHPVAVGGDLELTAKRSQLFSFKISHRNVNGLETLTPPSKTLEP